jgi:Fe-S oxidoreductase
MLDHAMKTGATTIITANPGCYLQLRRGAIEHSSGIAVLHLVEVLDAVTAPVVSGASGAYNADLSPRA